MKEIQIDKNSLLIKALLKADFLYHYEVREGIDSCKLNWKIFKFCFFLLFVFSLVTFVSVVVIALLSDWLAWIVFIILNEFVHPNDLAAITSIILSVSIVVTLILFVARHDKQIKSITDAIVPTHVTELYDSAKNRFCKRVVFVENIETEK